MKKTIYLLFALLAVFTACTEDDDISEYITYDVSVQLNYPETWTQGAKEGVKVKLTNSSGSSFESVTNSSGQASFKVPTGIYEASASDIVSLNGYSYIFNGIISNIVISQIWDGQPVTLSLTESKSSQVIIKELYVGGCQKDDGSGNFHMDKYVILYNNSDLPAELDNLCIGMVLPWNAHATNNDYVNGKLIYEDLNWLPAGTGLWFSQNSVRIEPRQQMVIALNGAIDHTQTYSNSVDLSNPSYYCTYDIAVYTNTTYYPAPSANIPTSNYFSAVHFGSGNAWPLSNTSPAFYIFQTQGVSPADFANDPENVNYHGGNATASNRRIMVPREWIIDAVEVYTTTSEKNQKRLTSDIDAGYVYLKNQQGYTIYRNVNKELTEALEENLGKLVYSYSYGTSESTDKSLIDAEASIKNGAKIIYMDTNNSSNDFHQRSVSSLKN